MTPGGRADGGPRADDVPAVVAGQGTAGLGLAGERLRPPELWELVAGRLREAVLDGRVGAGTRLVEAELAEEFGVSRGPIRDALRELGREGLLVDLPRRGTVVSTLGLADLREVYAIREGLEAVAARSAIERTTDDELASLRGPIEEMEDAWDVRAEYSVSLAADLSFHRRLVELSGNGRLVAVYEQMLSQTQLLARTAERINPGLREGMARSVHGDILVALVGRDPGAVAAALEAHYRYAGERLFGSP